MNKTMAALAGAGVGAGLMYLLDPVAGRRRRALLRDKSMKLARNVKCELQIGLEDLSNRQPARRRREGET